MTTEPSQHTNTGENGLLTLDNVVKHFDISGGLLDQLRFQNGRITRQRTTVKAVNNVSFTIAPGETFSVVGESGCGKSTLARTTIGIYPPNGGQIQYRGERIDNKNSQEMLPFRRKMQMIFQDPFASLNPRKTVMQTLEEPVVFHNPSITRGQVKERVAEVMSQVGVDPKWAGRYPHEFSGGQRQRIGLARTLALSPRLIIADEPVSAGVRSVHARAPVGAVLPVLRAFFCSHAAAGQTKGHCGQHTHQGPETAYLCRHDDVSGLQYWPDTQASR